MFNSGIKGRLLVMLVMAGVALFGYFSKMQVNPVTGQRQKVSMTPQEEVALGLQSAPSMAAEYGGLYQDEKAQFLVKKIGQSIIQSTEAKNSPYQFDFHVLADPETVNAFAVPGGQIFITMGLLKRLKTEDQLAGVLGHEIGHVIGRHSAQQMAKQELIAGLAGAATVGMSDGGYSNGAVAQYVANLMNLKYGRDDELEADDFGVKYAIGTGHNPEAMIEVMKILDEAAGGSGESKSDFTSTHPSPENRILKIKEAMAKYRQ